MKALFVAALLGGVFLLSCSDDNGLTSENGVTADDEAADDAAELDAGADDEPAEKEPWAEPKNLDDALTTYADIAFASYSDSLVTAQALDIAIADFLDGPSEHGLNAARQAWLDAREPYLQTEVYRFYEGPIDNEDEGPEGLMNAWPLDESHIDYVEGDNTAGLINDADFSITKTNLEEQNEKGGEKNIATGYHAIEFLLWGQDTADDGPGDRPYTDYVTGEEGPAANADRRGKYLSTISSLLVDHLEALTLAWDPEEGGNYREDFVDGGMDSLEKILTGMIVLSGFETGGERLQAALDAKDQEEEHSCFSDNTHRDMVQDTRGVENVYLGRYNSSAGNDVSGTGVGELLVKADPELAAELKTLISKSVKKAEALQPPFDQEIAPGNDAGEARVQAVIDALFAQEAELQKVFQGYGFSVPTPE